MVSSKPAMMIHYTGSSMSPVLKKGDCLTVLPYEPVKLRQGDVILCRPDAMDHGVVHRVVSVDPQGIRTKGDNNTVIDPWTLSPDEISGRVAFADRMGRRIAIRGGMWDRAITLRLIRIRHRLYRVIHSHCTSSAPEVRRKSHLRSILCRWFSLHTHVLYFRRRRGTEMLLVMGGRIIGRLLPGRDQWHIRWPFQLLIDETVLPKVIRHNESDTSPE